LSRSNLTGGGCLYVHGGAEENKRRGGLYEGEEGVEKRVEVDVAANDQTFESFRERRVSDIRINEVMTKIFKKKNMPEKNNDFNLLMTLIINT
jgi:hypothetical protein